MLKGSAHDSESKSHVANFSGLCEQIVAMTPSHICVTCHTQDCPRSAIKGSVILELFLWLSAVVCTLAISFLLGVFALAVAIAYSVFRLASRKRVCPSCGSADVIPISSPRARSLVQ